MPLGPFALMRATKALDPQPMKVVVHTTNPEHLIPSAGTPSDNAALRSALSRGCP